MSSSKQGRKAGLDRRDLFSAAAFMAAAPAAASAATAPTPDVYTRLGVRPFINTTATLTINGGSRLLPEVVAAIEQASQFHVNMDELMEKASVRLAEVLQVPWGIVTSGAAASLTHATVACIVGTDPEKMQQLPDMRGLKNQVIMPKESRNVYDQATRTVGVEIVEVNSAAELEAVRLPFGLGIERDLHFEARHALSVYAEAARAAGSIILGEQRLHAAARRLSGRG